MEDLDFYIGDEAFDATGYAVKVNKIYLTYFIFPKILNVIHVFFLI